ncbi:hypothetical protein HDV01_004277 [Terramyces sp. JEL0728]|nr:hypothetical protein HDV01_004277 [Terramyces sp. JEL0728]
MNVTPRTKIDGAHQQGVYVKAGAKLSSSKSIFLYKRFYFFIAFCIPFLASDWIPSTSSIGIFKQRIVNSFAALAYLPSGLQFVSLLLVAFIGYTLSTIGRPYLRFAYNCFIKPFLKKKSTGIDSDEHQSRLEEFYEGQADVYDVTRRRLLRGRSTMLKLCAAQLRQLYPCDFTSVFKGDRNGLYTNEKGEPMSPPLSPAFLSCAGKRFAWIDIGGGTGENIERMNQFFPISNFDRVYLVDITPSLCEIARKRFERLGWTNVKVLCMDASKFEVPAEDGDDLDIALITMSYSLTMIETYYPIVDRIAQVLAPTGIFGVADFYVSPKRSADPTRQLGWFMRWFWAIWFDSDNVYLSPGRREYLEHKFKTVKTLNSLNNFIKPFVKIPYYVWIGAQKAALPSLANFSLDGTGNPEGVPEIPDDVSVVSDDMDVETTAVEKKEELHVSSNHVHGQGLRWRQPFDPKLIDRFSTYIYAFAWEDPRVDLQFLDLKPEDHMFVITSGGCNVLEYAIKAGPQRIHSVDLNPCQNHMLELKLAALTSLCYEDYWKLLGEGFVKDFQILLDTHLSPNLSPYAYDFWKKTGNFKNLFKTGCSGLAVRVFNFVIKLRRLQPIVERMCTAETIEEQNRIWTEELRPHLLNKWLIRILNNDRFLWGALGVPPAQMQMLLEEGSAHEYCVNTFDPVIAKSHLRDDNYFFYMPLMLKYNKAATGNPAYLTEEGYNLLLAEPHRIDAIKIHTDYIINVLKTIKDGELTKVILMDHLDWFSEEDAKAEIAAVHQKMAAGGYVFWRSAGKAPWYNVLFEQQGFKVKVCQVREGETMFIDRVNMYASFWMGIKQ